MSKRFFLILLCCLPFMAQAEDASNRAAVPPQPDFSPPPVPDFMLHKPDHPLTLEEMRKMADEAARRARVPAPAAAAVDSVPPAAPPAK